MEGQAASPSGVEPDAPDPTAAAGAQQGQSSQHGGGGGSRRQQRYDDHFMMFVWKVEMCKRMDKHDREQCPYAHPGELARRRHPSLYQALPCPEARAKKICPRLENCNCSHSTFEFWLHPDRYKTFMCERGEACDRPTCFFAHSSDELRELPQGLRRTQVPGRPPAASAAPSSSSSFGHPPGASQHQQGAAGPQSGWGYAGSSIPSHHQQQHEQHRGAAAPQAPAAGAQGRTMAACLPAGMPGSSRQGSAAGARVPEGHRGATVAVVPAGPSVWQQNSMLQNESGEAPNLEELCAAVARMATPGQQQTDEQPGGLMYLPLAQQQQQQVGAIGAVPPQYPLALMGGQQVAPGLMPVGQVFAQQQQQQQQQAIPQPVLLPGGQVVYVQLPPQQGGSAGAADQFPWASMQPRG